MTIHSQARRRFLQMLALGALVAGIPFIVRETAMAEKTANPLNLSPEEWHQRLTAQQYDILRQQGTERAFTSPLYTEHRKGTFLCAGCDQPLFTSDMKFDSGTGWPSFFETLPDVFKTSTDHKLVMARTEYHCAKCGGHHGHVFPDGPAPTGLRYCNNGAVLKFVPAG